MVAIQEEEEPNKAKNLIRQDSENFLAVNIYGKNEEEKFHDDSYSETDYLGSTSYKPDTNTKKKASMSEIKVTVEYENGQERTASLQQQFKDPHATSSSGFSAVYHANDG